jgi:hypothetical protein
MKNYFDRVTVQNSSLQGRLSVRECCEPGERAARLSRLLGEPGQQIEHEGFVAKQVPAGESELGQGDLNRTEEVEVALDAEVAQLERC